MTNGHGNGHGGAAAAAHGAAAPTAHLTPEGHLEEILHDISSAEETNFKDHMEYRSPQNRSRMRYDSFITVEGGTEKLFDDVYHSAYKTAKESGLKGKSDPKSVADTLELVVVEALKKIKSPFETHLWKNFEAMKATRSFRSDDERMAKLMQLAGYLGASQEDIGQLTNGLEAEDPLMWNQSVREFTNKLKEGIINLYVGKHRMRFVNQDNEHKFKAYLVKYQRENLGVEPKNLVKYLAPEHTVQNALQPIAQLQTIRNPQAYNALDVKEYKAPAKAGAGHGGHP